MSKRFLKCTVTSFLMIAVILGAAAIPSSEKRGSSEIDNLRKWYVVYQVNGIAAHDGEAGDEMYYTQATKYLGAVFYYVIKRSGGKVETYEASIGYRVKRKADGRKGFVTCGHGLELTKDYYVYSNAGTTSTSVFGKIQNPILNNNDCDACFVYVNSGITLSDKTHGRGGSKASISPTVATVKKGDTLYKCGSKTGVTSGEVAWAYGETYVYDDISDYRHFMKNVICFKGISKKGDSGAPVYKKVNGKNQLVGIVIYANEYSTIVMDAKEINSRLGVTPY